MDGGGDGVPRVDKDEVVALRRRLSALEMELEILKDVFAKWKVVGNDTASTSHVETSVKEDNCGGGSSSSCDMLSEGTNIVDESVSWPY
jgi:hypothetical protein